MHYIVENKNILKKYDVIFNKELLGNLLNEVDKSTIVKHCFSSVKSMHDFYTDNTMKNIKVTEDGKDIFISYDKEFKTKLYYILDGILKDDEMSIYELFDLNEEYQEKVKNKTITEDELKDYKYLLESLKIIKFNIVSIVNIHSDVQIAKFLEGIHYSRVNSQIHK